MINVNEEVKTNEGLVGMVIKKYFPTHINNEDIYQIGLIALWKAVEQKNKIKGNFSTYAVKTIRNKITDELRKEQRLKNTLPKEMKVINLDNILNEELYEELFGVEDNGFEKVDIKTLLNTKNKLKESVLNLIAMGYEKSDVAVILQVELEFVNSILKEIERDYRN